jgi:hypothetical protein
MLLQVKRRSRLCRYCLTRFDQAVRTFDCWHLWCERYRLVVVFPCGWWEREAGADERAAPRLHRRQHDVLPGLPQCGDRAGLAPHLQPPPHRRRRVRGVREADRRPLREIRQAVRQAGHSGAAREFPRGLIASPGPVPTRCRCASRQFEQVVRSRRSELVDNGKLAGFSSA